MHSQQKTYFMFGDTNPHEVLVLHFIQAHRASVAYLGWYSGKTFGTSVILMLDGRLIKMPCWRSEAGQNVKHNWTTIMHVAQSCSVSLCLCCSVQQHWFTSHQRQYPRCFLPDIAGQAMDHVMTGTQGPLASVTGGHEPDPCDHQSAGRQQQPYAGTNEHKGTRCGPQALCFMEDAHRLLYT